MAIILNAICYNTLSNLHVQDLIIYRESTQRKHLKTVLTDHRCDEKFLFVIQEKRIYQSIRYTDRSMHYIKTILHYTGIGR